MGGGYSIHGRNGYKIMVRKLETKRPLGRPKCRWEDIRINVKEMGGGRCELNTSGWGYGPVVGFCEHSSEFLGSIKGWEFID